jgi:S-DNA-T family DNA segregation ATPase FtsK/SpoIIIE
MTFPLGSLRADGAPPPRASRKAASAPGNAGGLRWPRQFGLIIAAVVWLLVLLALVTHDAADPGFSTSGQGELITNRAGLLGAWVSDLALFLFGYSAWWLMLVS